MLEYTSRPVLGDLEGSSRNLEDSIREPANAHGGTDGAPVNDDRTPLLRPGQEVLSRTGVVRRLFQDRATLLVIGVYGVCLGVSINILNNGMAMFAALLDGPCPSSHLIVFTGVAQTAGRIVVCVGTALGSGSNNARGNGRVFFHPIVFTIVIALIEVVALGALAGAGLSCLGIWLMELAVAFAYGMSWTLFYVALRYATPPTLLQHFGELVGLATVLGPGLAPPFFAALFGLVYDGSGYTAADGSTQCTGDACFHTSLLVCAVAAGVAAVVGCYIYRLLRVQSKQ